MSMRVGDRSRFGAYATREVRQASVSSLEEFVPSRVTWAKDVVDNEKRLRSRTVMDKSKFLEERDKQTRGFALLSLLNRHAENSEILRLLDQGEIDSLQMGHALIALSENSGEDDRLLYVRNAKERQRYHDNRALMKKLLDKGGMSAKHKWIALVNLSQREGTDDLIRQMLEEGQVPSHVKMSVLQNLIAREGDETLIIFLWEGVDLQCRKELFRKLIQREGIDETLLRVCKATNFDAQEKGRLLVFFSKRAGSNDLMLYLLREEVIDARYRGRALVRCAQREGTDEVMLTLLQEGGIDLEKIGETIVHLAAREGCDGLIWQLLEQGEISVYHSGRALTKFALREGTDALMLHMLARGVEKEERGIALLHLTARGRSDSLVKQLFEGEEEIDPLYKGEIMKNLSLKEGTEGLMELLSFDQDLPVLARAHVLVNIVGRKHLESVRESLLAYNRELFVN